MPEPTSSSRRGPNPASSPRRGPQPRAAPSPHCLVERDAHVVTVTMNRPEARNALSPEMLARMDDAWQMIEDDDEVRVAILTGAGGDFCSGMDLKAFASGFGDDPWTPRFAE